jgi:hypothetical protein
MILVLANSPSQPLPAYLFSPRASTRSYWSATGACQHSPSDKRVTAFHDLFQHAFDKDKQVQIKHGRDESLSYTDTLSDSSLAGLGPELRDLVKHSHINISRQNGNMLLGLSKQLRRGAWELFATDPHEYIQSRTCLLTLVAHYLPDPYTEPLWETILFGCKELVTSTLIPMLCSWPRSVTQQRNLTTETTVCILAFKLAILGYSLKNIPWECLIGDWLHSKAKLFIEIQELLSSMLHDGTSFSVVIQRLETLEPFVNPLYSSLFWITIARMRWTSNAELQEYCNARHPWGSIDADSPRPEIGEIAHALVCPESVSVKHASLRLSFPALGALGAGLSQFGHPKASVDLLELSLRSYEKTGSRLSLAYGFLFAELIKNYNKLGRSEEARMMGYAYLKRPHDSLPADRSDRVYVMITTSDACIALKYYGEARKLLSDVLSKSDLDAYTEICSALRLNKVWRRRNDEDYEAGFAENLGRVLPLTFEEDAMVKEEFLTELQATAYHTKQAQKPLSPPLRATVNSTIQLYQQDDHVIFHESLETLRHLSQVDDTTVRSDFDIMSTHTLSYSNHNAAESETSDPSFRSLMSNHRPLSAVQSQSPVPSENILHARYNPSIANIRTPPNSPTPSSVKRNHITRFFQSPERCSSSVSWQERNLLSLGTWCLKKLQIIGTCHES